MKSLLSIVLMLIAQHIYSQMQEHTIDFLKIDDATVRSTFSYNQKARVRINNINRFIYKVSTEKTEEDFNIAVPSVLSSIKLPAYWTDNGAASPTAKAVALAQTADPLQTDFDNKLIDLILVYKDINIAIDIHNDVVHLSKDCSNDFQMIESNSIAKLNMLFSNTTVSGLADDMQSYLEGKISISNGIVEDLERLYAAWKSASLTEVRAAQIINDDRLASLTRELKNTAASSVPAKQKDIRDLERQIKQDAEDYTFAIEKNKAVLEKAKSIQAEVKKYKEDGKFFQLADDIRKVNRSNYTYYSETVTMKKDEYKFKISVTSEDKLTCNIPNEQKIEVVLRTKGGVKLDFSTGIFTMLGDQDFLGRNYYYKPLNATESTIAAIDNDNKALLGLGGLLHIYRRSPSTFKVGVAIGASSSLNFDVLNFHLGPSFIIGDKNRLCVTLGITAREVKLLDKRYTINQVYLNNDLPENIPTSNTFPQIGTFVSLTYNIYGFNK